MPLESGAKMSLSLSKSPGIFDRYLSDLCSPSGESIGALGRDADSDPGESGAASEGFANRLFRQAEEWRD
ncbi:MAG TPA: hypothetical protein VIT45_06575 [Allosphingosinicella sp.]